MKVGDNNDHGIIFCSAFFLEGPVTMNGLEEKWLVNCRNLGCCFFFLQENLRLLIHACNIQSYVVL